MGEWLGMKIKLKVQLSAKAEQSNPSQTNQTFQTPLITHLCLHTVCPKGPDKNYLPIARAMKQL